jgi:hypothetical protein
MNDHIKARAMDLAVECADFVTAVSNRNDLIRVFLEEFVRHCVNIDTQATEFLAPDSTTSDSSEIESAPKLQHDL